MILLLNGAFGVGKTSVARSLVARLPRTILFDPEIIGIPLQRLARLAGRRIDDFQDLRLWRRLTVIGLRVTRLHWPNVVVPMAFSNAAYLQEIRMGLERFETHVDHFCLVAPIEVIHERLRRRGDDPIRDAWQYRRAEECCRIHAQEDFSTRVVTTARDTDNIADEIVRALASR